MSEFYGLNLSTPLEDLIPPPPALNDTHKQYSLAITFIVLGAVTTIIAFVRLVTRFASRTSGADDWAIIPAIVLYFAWIILAVYMNLAAGIAKPLWEITVGEYSIWFQCIIAALFIYPTMSASVRVSIILLYRRIFEKGGRYRKIILHSLLGLQAAYVVVFSILPGFVCRPIGNVKYPLEHTTWCDDLFYARMQTGLFSTSVAFDFILLVAPIFWVLKLQLPLKKRVGLAIIFVLGAGAGIAAAYKLAVQVTETYDHKPQSLQCKYAPPGWLSWARLTMIGYNYLMSRFIPTQFESYGTTFWISSVVEPTVALIGTSLPALYQLGMITSEKYSTIKNTPKASYTSRQNKSSKGGLKGNRWIGRQQVDNYNSHDSDIELRGDIA
ncbi:hypothetical protein F4810DRAFT_717715 [Camillea tinctor]|nr:hypothetical protein F4810DRAFT_717715 [Camillea tinctor]